MEVKGIKPITEAEALSKVEGEEGTYVGEMIEMRRQVVLGEKKAKALAKALKEALPDAPEEFIVKVVDVLPINAQTVMTLAVNYYEVDEEKAQRVVDIVLDHLS